MANLKLPNGAQLAIVTGFAAAKAVSALTNADPGVMTLEASHGVVEGDLFALFNSWSKTNNRIFRAGEVATNAVDVEGLDTTDTDLYPAGSGVGTIQEVSGWSQILNVLNFQSEGGEQQYATAQVLEEEDETRLPTTRSAQGLQISVGDDTSKAWYAYAKAASDSGDATAMRLLLKNGDFILYYGTLTLDETPVIQVNTPMSLRMSLSLLGRPTRYAAAA